MKLKNYTVVSCSNCENVWIVKGNPDRSGCTRCGKTRKFRLLKKYKSVNSLERAQLIRSAVRSKVVGKEKEFSDLLDEGVLTESPDESSSKSFEEAFRESVQECDSKDEIVSSFEDSRFSASKAGSYYDKYRKKGQIIETSDSIRFIE